MVRHRDRLRYAVGLRLDPRVRARIDAADVIQEVFLEAVRRLDEYRANPRMSFFVWLRFLAFQKVLELHRFHLGAGRRDARREVPLEGRTGFGAAFDRVVPASFSREGTPSEAAVREEEKEILRVALARMDSADREILALRHFDHLTNAEAAHALGIRQAAASKRYVRALARLRQMLGGTARN